MRQFAAQTTAPTSTVLGHLEELRKRAWLCVGSVVLASALSLHWSGWVIEWLKRPAGMALPALAYFSPAEAFIAYMKISVMAGVVCSMPVILHQLWRFVQPGLTSGESRYGRVLVRFGSLLFLAGGAFAYWVILPGSLSFLLGFGGAQLQPVISIDRYLSFASSVIFACGAVFQLPLVVFVLTKLRVVDAALLQSKWRHAAVVVLIAAAILTPTAVAATLLLLAVPMLGLYEVSVWDLRGCRVRPETP